MIYQHAKLQMTVSGCSLVTAIKSEANCTRKFRVAPTLLAICVRSAAVAYLLKINFDAVFEDPRLHGIPTQKFVRSLCCYYWWWEIRK
jgi:hypothetical protein